MASLQAALKSAIQVTFQLEDSELAVESLPSNQDRRVIMIYESAEGGAGVLRRLVEDPTALAQVALRHQVLVITHLPQIAARGDRHLRIAKATRDGMATSDVTRLHGEDRVLEATRDCHPTRAT